MEIGLICAGGAPEVVERYVQTAEELGFASLWVPEHVAFFESYDATYPYSETGRPPMSTDTPMLEPLTLLSFIAAKTRRVRLATGVFLLPQRNPVYTAKEVTTVDILSGGRLDLGIGVGWLREEFEAVGVPFERRGARCDEYLEIVKRLWTAPAAEFEGEFYRLPRCVQEPRPTQKPHPPILVGGVSEPAMRRAARSGDGWVAINLSPQEAAEQVGRMQSMRREAGREGRFRTFMMATAYPVEPSQLEAYRDAGIDQIVLAPMEGKDVIRGPDDLFRMVEERAAAFVEPASRL
jgi:probable F420-dependent oxidoreductase